MDLSQESEFVLSVLRGQDKRWHVTEEGFGQLLDSFDNPHDACAWAVARAEPKRGRVFVEKVLVDYSDSPANPKSVFQYQDSIDCHSERGYASPSGIA